VSLRSHTPAPPCAAVRADCTPGRDNPAMALKLFRSTGYSTLLMPGEARLGTHPATLVLWTSAWLAVPCNVAVWRLVDGTASDLRVALASVLLLAGGSGVFLSVFGWRRTLKAAITLALVVAALVACGLWTQELPVETLWHGPSRALLPPWANFLRWQVLALVVVLALVPIVWLWNHKVRRLSGQEQWKSNALGAIAGLLVFGLGLAALA
jgi:glucan phosphoethanolaminetransferase (alkaline phosphatase superfamily)